jgi:hypothetical protein
MLLPLRIPGTRSDQASMAAGGGLGNRLAAAGAFALTTSIASAVL